MIIQAKNISKKFSIKGQNVTQVLQDLDVEIKENEFVALMGPSGVGKSTLLYILSSLDNSDSGEIFFNDNDKQIEYSKLKDKDLSKFRNQKTGFIFQFHHLLPEFTALENIMIPALIKGSSSSDAKKKAIILMDRVGVSHRAEHKPAQLSGGEQQRIAIARALINEPKIVFADEPTGNLDAANSEQVLKLMTELNKELKTTFVIATHSNDVASVADRILILGNGKISKEITN